MRKRSWLLCVFAGAVASLSLPAQRTASNDVAAILQRQTQELFDAMCPVRRLYGSDIWTRITA